MEFQDLAIFSPQTSFGAVYHGMFRFPVEAVPHNTLHNPNETSDQDDIDMVAVNFSQSANYLLRIILVLC